MSSKAIELRGVRKRYPHFDLKSIDLDLECGCVMGLIGPNGAGKSTTLRIIMGLIHPDAGQVRVLGHEMPAEQVAAKLDIGFVSEDMRLYKGQTLAWHMRFVQSIFPTWDPAYAQTLVKRFDLNIKQKIKGMSHGQRVKATLLLALARRPQLLVLDEPTTGLDPVARSEVLQELMAVLADQDRTVLFSSHNTQDVERISDQITFIDRGQVVDSQDKESFLDKWRRLRLEIPLDHTLPEMEHIVEVNQSGHVAVVTTNQYSEDLAGAYLQAGAKVDRIESMTLEEIFVAEVKQYREVRA